ncbi:SH3 domain-containing protein [Desulfovibrio sp. OttesenSCG-928-I05]|nr:SH3 domain-containing protein [Desulfovibrio sp. OttesenSCG-928-I05]
MRVLFAALLFFALTPLSPVQASGMTAGVMDSDPKGANVRATPSRSGKITNVVHYPGSQEALYERRVMITGQNGEWFSVILQDASDGWMHKSILGMCASAAEDAPCELRAEPGNAAKRLATIPAGTALGLEGFSDGWVKVSYAGTAAGKDGKALVGWLPEECLFASGVCIAGENALTIRNKTEFLTLISFEIIAKDTRLAVSPLIAPDRSMTVQRPADGKADLDCYMGMPNNIHFLFRDVPFDKADTILVHWSEESNPELELLSGGKSLGRLSGTMTHDDLRGDMDEEDKKE